MAEGTSGGWYSKVGPDTVESPSPHAVPRQRPPDPAPVPKLAAVTRGWLPIDSLKDRPADWSDIDVVRWLTVRSWAEGAIVRRTRLDPQYVRSLIRKVDAEMVREMAEGGVEWRARTANFYDALAAESVTSFYADADANWAWARS